MRICHLSDTHAKFPPLKGIFDVVVHSGDWLPDFLAPYEFRAEAQEGWIIKNIDTIRTWLNNKPFLFSQGNHDFANPDRVEKLLRQAGIQAYNTENKIVSLFDYNFYGFPWLPYINGNFNYELEEKPMITEINNLADTLNKNYVDVLIAHCPPYKLLAEDLRNGIEYGNREFRQLLDFKLQKDMMPQLICTGHIHSGSGIKPYKNTLISNAATTQFILEI